VEHFVKSVTRSRKEADLLSGDHGDGPGPRQKAERGAVRILLCEGGDESGAAFGREINRISGGLVVS